METGIGSIPVFVAETLKESCTGKCFSDVKMKGSNRMEGVTC